MFPNSNDNCLLGGVLAIDKIKFVNHSASPVWKSHDGIIRLIDYDDKNDANELIQRLERILYGK